MISFLNNGEIFVISGYSFGQGEGEGRLWVDMNVLDKEYFTELKAKVAPPEPCQVDIQKSAQDYLSERLVTYPDARED